LLIFIYIGISEPFQRASQNKRELVNEFLVVMITDTLFLFTEFCPDLDLKYKMGWVYILFMVLCIIYNGYYVLGSIWSSISEVKCFKKKKQRHLFIIGNNQQIHLPIKTINIFDLAKKEENDKAEE
jgi:hypothetical protein